MEARRRDRPGGDRHHLRASSRCSCRSRFMAGIPGKFFEQFGLTVAVAVLFSLVVARLLTPMMAAYILKPAEHRRGAATAAVMPALHARCCSGACGTAARRRSRRSASSSARSRWCRCCRPASSAGDLIADAGRHRAAAGRHPRADRAAAEQARAILRQRPDVEPSTPGRRRPSGAAFAPGAGRPPSGRPAQRQPDVTWRREPSAASASRTSSRRCAALEALPGARVKFGLGGRRTRYVQWRWSGDDPRRCAAAARDRGAATCARLPASATSAPPRSLVRPEIDRAAPTWRAPPTSASRRPRSPRRCASPPSATYDQALAKLNLRERQVPIRRQAAERGARRPRSLARLTVPGARGPVMLATSPTITIGSGPAQIDRLRPQRNVNFEIELNGLPLGEVDEAVAALPSMQAPAGRRAQPRIGDAEVMAELFGSFGLAMRPACCASTSCWCCCSSDFLQPVTILAALPLSIGGAFVALLLTRTALSMPSMIGLIMLMGIVDEELDPAGRVRDHGARATGHEPRSTRCSTPATSAPGRSS